MNARALIAVLWLMSCGVAESPGGGGSNGVITGTSGPASNKPAAHPMGGGSTDPNAGNTCRVDGGICFNGGECCGAVCCAISEMCCAGVCRVLSVGSSSCNSP